MHTLRRIVRDSLLLVLALGSSTAARADFDSGRLSFSVDVQGETTPYRVLAISALPGEKLRPEIARCPTCTTGTAFDFTAERGEILDRSRRHAHWRAPSEPGLAVISIERLDTKERMTLNVLVLVPAERIQGETHNGYRFGSYPSTPLRGLAIYRPPRGFIEVTPDLLEVAVAPHFTLRQFLCKQQPEANPKYLALRSRLLLKLEYLLERVNRKGFAADTFFIMSGFRTPSYNKAIGNVKYSRHQWGGAADIFLDVAPRDGVMDDLDGNGKIDVRDARLLADLIEEHFDDADYQKFVGGLGLYGTTATHGPFVHVDVRGFRARWGR